MIRMTFQEATARRLTRHGLSEPVPPAAVIDQVAAIGGAHAQVMSAAELSIALRVGGITRAHVREALWEDHRLVKTWGPRGTLHLLAAKDLALWTAALGAIPGKRNQHAPDVRLGAEQTDQVVAAIGDALADAELTIDELSEAVVARTGSWAGDLVMPAFQGMWPRWRQAMDVAANAGVLCCAPNRGRKVTYTNPRRWLPDFEPMDPDEALRGVVRRYLHAYGPATSEQFARWLAAPPRWTADLLFSLGEELELVNFDGDPSWVLAGDTDWFGELPRGVRLLPYFDAYSVGCHPREKLFPGAAKERALAGGQAGNFPVLLVDGVVAGVWHQKRSGARVKITVEPITDLTAAQRRELDEQVERVADLFHPHPARADLTIGAVCVGAHA